MQPCPTNIVIHEIKVCLCNDHIFLKKTNQLNHIVHILQASNCKAELGSFTICWCCHSVVIDFSKTSVSLPIWACMPTIAAAWLIFGEVEEEAYNREPLYDLEAPLPQFGLLPE